MKEIKILRDGFADAQGDADLEVTGSASAASGLLMELPCPIRWQGFRGRGLGRPPRLIHARCTGRREGILRKLGLLGARALCQSRSPASL